MSMPISTAYIVPGLHPDEDLKYWLQQYIPLEVVDEPEKGDLYVFGPGPDVYPPLYGEQPLYTTDAYPELDKDHTVAYLDAYRRGLPMLGIGRGAQLLHVQQKGRLYQDVNNHTEEHLMLDTHTNEVIKVQSSHHQMIRKSWRDPSYSRDFFVLGRTPVPLASFFASTDAGAMMPGEDMTNVEAFLYEQAGLLGIQGHPQEYDLYPDFADWAGKTVSNWLEGLPSFIQRKPL